VSRRGKNGVQFRHAHLHGDSVIGDIEFAGVRVTHDGVEHLAVVPSFGGAVGIPLVAIHVRVRLHEELITVIRGGERVFAGRTHHIVRRVDRETHLPRRLARD
jgi:hypothetical protein